MADNTKRIRDLARRPKTTLRRVLGASGITMVPGKNLPEVGIMVPRGTVHDPKSPKCTCHACRGRKGGLAKVPKGAAKWSAGKRLAMARKAGKARAAGAKRNGVGEFKSNPGNRGQ